MFFDIWNQIRLQSIFIFVITTVMETEEVVGKLETTSRASLKPLRGGGGGRKLSILKRKRQKPISYYRLPGEAYTISHNLSNLVRFFSSRPDYLLQGHLLA